MHRALTWSKTARTRLDFGTARTTPSSGYLAGLPEHEAPQHGAALCGSDSQPRDSQMRYHSRFTALSCRLALFYLTAALRPKPCPPWMLSQAGLKSRPFLTSLTWRVLQILIVRLPISPTFARGRCFYSPQWNPFGDAMIFLPASLLRAHHPIGASTNATALGELNERGFLRPRLLRFCRLALSASGLTLSSLSPERWRGTSSSLRTRENRPTFRPGKSESSKP